MRRLAIGARRVEGLSGAARLIIEEARAAARSGWEVHVFAERLDLGAIKAAGAIAHRVPAWPWGSWIKRRLFAALAEREVRGFEFVHGHGDLLAQDVLSLHNGVHAAREALTGRPLPPEDAVGRMHAIQLDEKRFRVLIANSELLKNDVMSRFHIPAQQIEVLYPGFDPARFRAQDRERLGLPLRAELGLKPDDFLVGLVTSGDFEKRGLPAFLRAFAATARRFPSSRALIAGKTSRPREVLGLAGELGVADRVFLRDPEASVEKLYHALDAYVHAARWEEFGMTVLEAMACGVPIVTGARVGAAELLSGGSREFILGDPSPEALSGALSALALAPERRSRWRSLGPAMAARCTWDAHNRALCALYERLSKK